MEDANAPPAPRKRHVNAPRPNSGRTPHVKRSPTRPPFFLHLWPSLMTWASNFAQYCISLLPQILRRNAFPLHSTSSGQGCLPSAKVCHPQTSTWGRSLPNDQRTFGAQLPDDPTSVSEADLLMSIRHDFQSITKGYPTFQTSRRYTACKF